MVPGEATTQPSTPPPQVGNCVIEDPKDLGADLYTWTTVLPTVSTGRCAGDRFGEVTGVLPARTARAFIAGTIAHPSVGQDWAACLVYLPLSGDAAVSLRIDHSLRGAWQHPVDSRLFTVWWEQAVPFLLGNCFALHALEVLGAARLPAGTAPEAATAACREFAVATRRSSAAWTAETSTSNSSRYDPTPTTEPC